MAALLQRRPEQNRIFALTVLTCLYIVIFTYLHETWQAEFTPLVTIPLILGAWWFGFRPGILFAVFLFVVNSVVISKTLTPNLSDVIEAGGSGAVAMILIGGVTGKMRDLSHQLKRELSERKRSEEELRRHRANLESLVSARTSALEAAVQQLKEEIIEREQVQDVLKQSLEKEQRLNQLKSRFTSMVSHEFRTPLTVIQSSTELLEAYAERMEPPKKAEKFNTIKTQVSHMVELLNDILTLDRAESVGPVFNPQVRDIAAYCRAIVDEFKPTSRTHLVRLTMMPECRLVLIDEALIRRALWNLLSNAVKYSPAGTAIEVQIASEAEHVLISVKDYGIGIPEEDHKDIFEIFHRAHNVGSIQGTGLGLPIVKQAVLAHGGTITFKSENGVGTTFMIRLPVMVETAAEKSA